MRCQGGDRTPAFRVTAGRLAVDYLASVGTAGGSRTHDLVRTGDVLWLAELQGQVPRRHDSNVRPPPSDGGALSTLSYGELSVDGRGRTCTLRFRRPAP